MQKEEWQEALHLFSESYLSSNRKDGFPFATLGTEGKQGNRQEPQN